MSEPTKIERIPTTRQTKCLLCEEEYEQVNVSGKWFPASHRGCKNGPPDMRVEDRREFVPAAELRREQEMRAQLLNVPPLYQSVSLDNYGPTTPRQREILNDARRYVDDWPRHRELMWAFPQVVLMVGPFGTGKGHLAWSIARAVNSLTPRGGGVKMAKCSDLIRDLRQSWGSQEGESETRRLTHYRMLDLLIIDEVSAHALYGEPSRHLYDLIDHRQEWLRPTIVTSNEEAEGIADLLGPALVSRAAGWDGVWQFDGEDYRVRSRKARTA